MLLGGDHGLDRCGHALGDLDLDLVGADFLDRRVQLDLAAVEVEFAGDGIFQPLLRGCPARLDLGDEGFGATNALCQVQLSEAQAPPRFAR